MAAIVPAEESGLWRFGDKNSLINLLSIDYKCFGRNIRSACRCDHRLGAAKIQQIEEILARIAGQGLHSDSVATDLGNLLHACLCSKHGDAKLVTGYGKDLNDVPYTEYIRHIWDRRLWAVYLEAQGFPGDLPLAQGSPLSIIEVDQWKARASRVRALPVPPLLRRFSFFEKDDSLSMGYGATSVRNSTSSRATDIPKPVLRRASTFGSLDKLIRIGSRFGRKKPTTLQPPPLVKPILERKDETRHIPTLGTLAPSEDPVTPVKRGRRLNKDAIESVSPEPPSPSRAPPAPATHDSSSDRTRLALDDASPSPPPSAASAVFSLMSNGGFTPPTAQNDEAGPRDLVSANNGVVDYGNPLEDSPLHNKSTSRQYDTRPVKRDLFSSNTRAETRPDSPSKTASTGQFPAHSQCDSDEAPGTDSDTAPHCSLEESMRVTAPPGDQTQVRVSAGAEESNLGTAQVDSAHPDFKPWKNINEYESLAKILARLEKIVPSDNRGQGHIYLYTRNGAEDYIKIGYSKDPDERTKKWESTCKYHAITLKEVLMRSVPRVMEACIHHHLYQYRQDDLWCINGRVEEPSSGRKKIAGNKCTTRHNEWFRVGQGEAERVVDLWSRFNETTPYTRGRINSFWRDYVIDVGDEVKKWQQAGEPALRLWESIMEKGMKRWETGGFNDPLAEIKLVIRARTEGCDHVIEVLDPRKDGQPPMVATPLRLRMAAVKG